MRQTFLIPALLASAVPVAPAIAAPRPSPEAQLEKLLAGRTAGQPVSCINPRISSETQVIDHTAIVYGSGRTIYVQRPGNARALSSDDVLVTRLSGTDQLCDVDVVHLHDRSGGWWHGFVTLNRFVPYTRTRVAAGN
ncbi:hypothetical protein ACFOD9_11540 [Novosphingobium bradum]|uniref:SH3 domain-containing protein n=1 Tax=Novosphingobium bradum TaxID=1737444 RepID=A0ABV7IXG4_9SPHN